jgi:hypothetical protein
MNITTMSEAIATYDEMLYEVYGDVSIAGLEYDIVTALQRVDPVAYKLGFFDWADGEGIDTDSLEDDADLP